MKHLKPVDKAMFCMVSEFPGRNESKRIGILVTYKPNGRALICRAKTAFGSSKLTDTRSEHWRGFSDSTEKQDTSRNWRDLTHPGKKGPEKGKPYNCKTGNGKKGERESEGVIVAEKPLKDDGAKDPC